MFEIIKILIENVFGIVSKLPSALQRKRLGKIGTDLYLLYMAANHVVFNGEEIVEALEDAVRIEPTADASVSYVLRRKNGWEYGFAEKWMSSQCGALLELGYRIWRLSETFQVVDPESFIKLMRLLGGKANALDSLVLALRQNKIPTGDLRPEAIEQLLKLKITFNNERRRELIDPAMSQFLAITEPWDPATRRIVQEYLDVSRPGRGPSDSSRRVLGVSLVGNGKIK